jgi:hypothetical protein
MMMPAEILSSSAARSRRHSAGGSGNSRSSSANQSRNRHSSSSSVRFAQAKTLGIGRVRRQSQVERKMFSPAASARSSNAGTNRNMDGSTEKITNKSTKTTTVGGFLTTGHIKRMENQLCKNTSRLSSIKADSAKIMLNIDMLRRERLSLDSAMTSAETDLINIKSSLNGTSILESKIKTSKREFDFRIAAVTKTKSYERELFKKSSDYVHAELNKTESVRKNLHLSSVSNIGNYDHRRLSSLSTSAMNSSKSFFDEQVIMRRIFRVAVMNAIQRRHISQQRSSTKQFEAAFKSIAECTGIDNVDEIVRIFKDDENRNFSLLRFDSELHSEIEKKKNELNEYKDQIRFYQRMQIEKEKLMMMKTEGLNIINNNTTIISIELEASECI